MRAKMCVCGLLGLVIPPLSTLDGEEASPGGIVHGPKASFNISAPEGWVLDMDSGREQDLPCVLYPKGSSWADAKTAMYARMASPEWEGVNAFVEVAIKEMKAKHGIPKKKIATGKTKDGHDYFINEYPATKTYSQWERVGYVQLPQGVGYIVLTSRDKTSYSKDASALQEVLGNLTYVEPDGVKQHAAQLSGKQDGPNVQSNGGGQNYAARFKQLQSEKAPDGQIDSLLDEWRAQKSDDPDAWITSANYYFNKSVGVMLSAEKPKKGDIRLTNKKTGQTGSISYKPGIAQTSRNATDILQEATAKFPDRIDIWCGLAFIYQESGDFENELSTLKKMVAYAREHPSQLKWLKGESLDGPADKFVPEKLHEYGQYYERKENAEDDKRWYQISMLATEQYPNNPLGFNDAAGYWADIGEWQKARGSVEKAHQLDPKSVGALLNLGNISVEMKDFPGARKYFEEAVKLDPNGQYGQEAKKALEKLKKK
jgi:tetratricopeptide (TPR) repeat protein